MITGYVIGQVLQIHTPPVVADSVNYLEAQFIFQKREWDGLDVRAVFEHDGESYAKPLTGGRIRQEDGLNLTAGTWKVHLVGYVVEKGVLVQRITTGQAEILVLPSGSMDGGPLPEIPATDLERIDAVLDSHETRITHLEQYGGGGIIVEDDGEGNIVLRNSAGEMIELEDDGEGNLVIGGIG